LISGAVRSFASETPFHFNWEAQAVDVVEWCSNKTAVVEVVHHGQLTKTNDGLLLQWSPLTITKFNGKKVGEKSAWPAAARALEKSLAYPAFVISTNGELTETFEVVEATGAEATNADETPIDTLYEVIWRTWVGAWTEVELADGASESVGGLAELYDLEAPVTNKTSNLGATTGDTNLVSFKFEQTVAGTNFQSALNGLLAEGLEIKSPGPVTGACSLQRLSVLEVQTERQTLRPHWAKRTTRTTFSIPGEQIETEAEIREFHFQWGQTN
jgi:hypothetical protein